MISLPLFYNRSICSVPGLLPDQLYRVRVLAGTEVGYPTLPDHKWPWVSERTLSKDSPSTGKTIKTGERGYREGEKGYGEGKGIGREKGDLGRGDMRGKGALRIVKGKVEFYRGERG